MSSIFRKLKQRSRSRSQKDRASVSSAETIVNDALVPKKPITDVEPYQLLQLGTEVQKSDPNEPYYPVDIVVIHGLMGNLKKTWTHPNGVCWIEDLLPKSLPGARVFTYGYPSHIFLNRYVAEVRIFALRLLHCLRDKDIGNSHRPIFFICHSMGGIVLKKALIMSRDNIQFKGISQAHIGVMFMGTPHQGSDIADTVRKLGVVLNAVPQPLANLTSTKLLDSLRRDSEGLLSISQDFVNFTSQIEIWSLFEQKNCPPLNSLIVTESSALLRVPSEFARPCFRNHQDICRFADRSDQDFQFIVHEIQNWSTRLQSSGSPNVALSTSSSVERDCLALLNRSNLQNYTDSLGRYLDGTLKWFETCQEYIDWRKTNRSAALWISGHPGQGKTVIASYVSDRLHHERPVDSMLCYFFFNTLEKDLSTGECLLRTLIYQLVRRRPKLRKIVKRAYDHGGAQTFDRLDGLIDILRKIVCQDSHTTIYIVIDALDECSDVSRTLVAERLAALTRIREAATMKLLFTSRREQTERIKVKSSLPNFFNCNLGDYQRFVKDDIEKVVISRVNEITQVVASKPEIQLALTNSLVRGAESTFLWVSMVLNELEQRRVLSAADISALIDKPPTGLFNLYRSLIASIHPDESQRAAKVLHLIISSTRPISIKELSILMEIDASSLDAISLNDSSVWTIEMVTSFLGFLLRISDSRFYLYHSSFASFLRDLASEDTELSRTYGLAEHKGALETCVLCMQYLLLPNFDNDLGQIYASIAHTDRSPTQQRRCSVESYDNWNVEMFLEKDEYEHQHLAALGNTFELFDYAANQWAVLLRAHEANAGEHELQMARSLISANSNRTRNWFQYYCYTHNFQSPDTLGPLTISSYMGLGRLLDKIIAQNVFGSGEVNSSIYWASYFGHKECLGSLLRLANSRKPNPEVHESEYTINTHEENARIGVIDYHLACITATKNGHAECVKSLLHFTKDLTCDRHGRSLISLAASNGHLDVLRLLLLHPEFDPSMRCDTGFPPLFYAVFEAASGATRVLCEDSRVDVHERIAGRNALSWAAEIGDADVTRVLLEYGVDPTLIDDRGQTALLYAVKDGNFEVFKLLMAAARPDLNNAGEDGRNILSHAASQSDFRIVEQVLHSSPGSVDNLDKNGWSPLAWSLNPPGYFDNFLLLLTYGHAQYNQKDSVHERNSFSWAISYGYTLLVREMLNLADIESNAADNGGRTPASHAAATGKQDMVELLLASSKINWRIRDNNGRSPRDWAELQGHTHIVKLLGVVSD